MSENSTRAQIAAAISETAGHGTAFAGKLLGLGLGVLIALAPALSAAAETNPREADEDSSLLQEVVVTGSHFKTLNESSPSPVVVLGSEELQHLGTARAEDLLNSLPQANVGLSLAANGAGVSPLTGTAA